MVESNIAMVSNAPMAVAFPSAKALTRFEDVIAFEAQVASSVAAVDSVGQLQEWMSATEALVKYLTSKELHLPAMGAQRRIEARIGQLFGMADPHNAGRGKLLTTVSNFNPRIIREFRILAAGTHLLNDYDWRQSRSRLVTHLRSVLPPLPSKPIETHTSATGSTRANFALTICQKAFGDAGLTSALIEGFGLLYQRYGENLERSAAIDALTSMRGGSNGLMEKARTLKLQTGNSLPLCVAAAAVQVINSSRKGKKLASWWKSPDADGHSSNVTSLNG